MKYVIDHDCHIHSHLSTCSSDEGQTKEAILDIARNNGLFENSDTHIVTEHGPISSYDYQYREMSGTDCRELFIDSKMADTLQTRYSNLINKLIK